MVSLNVKSDVWHSEFCLFITQSQKWIHLLHDSHLQGLKELRDRKGNILMILNKQVINSLKLHTH